MEWWSVSITTFSLRLQETTRQAAITAESHRFPLQPDVYPSISIAVVHTVSIHYNKLCISYIIRSYTSLITTSVFVLCPVCFFFASDQALIQLKEHRHHNFQWNAGDTQTPLHPYWHKGWWKIKSSRTKSENNRLKDAVMQPCMLADVLLQQHYGRLLSCISWQRAFLQGSFPFGFPQSCVVTTFRIRCAPHLLQNWDGWVENNDCPSEPSRGERWDNADIGALLKKRHTHTHTPALSRVTWCLCALCGL